MFASEEAEAEARKESVKTFVPGEIPAPEVLKEEQAPKNVAPTPEQIIAIKVFSRAIVCYNSFCFYFIHTYQFFSFLKIKNSAA